MKIKSLHIIALALLFGNIAVALGQVKNPILHADVPDMSMIRVDDTYYMSSTTMHMSPGVPIMKSKDLVNWEIVNYAYDVLGDEDELEMENDKKAYGAGSWASSLRYHKGTFYVSTFASTTGKTHIFSTDDIENGSWEEISFAPAYHDNTLFFDDDGKAYLIWGAGKLNIAELKKDLTGIVENTKRVLIENATEPIGSDIILPAEGSQLFKIKDKYYLFNIAWPKDGMRTVIIHSADSITGPYEGEIAFQDKGVAQGGLIDTPDGDWFAYLFKDNGAVGRIPYLVPVQWKDGWPVLGENAKLPETLDLPASEALMPGIVASDNFDRGSDDRALPLVWQWNHNPQSDYWSVKDREGYLRLTTDRLDTSFLTTRNTLTQRTIGPESSAITKIDLSGMKQGDYAGLGLLQENFGFVGAYIQNDQKRLVMMKGSSVESQLVESIALNQDEIYLKTECDFKNQNDKASFYYSLDGENWKKIGNELSMSYTLPHFMGYRFALFNYATKEVGGYADFDFFKINDNIN